MSDYTDVPLLLTEREKEIAKLIVRGETNQYIRETLFISKHTLKAHISKLYYKYGLTNSTDSLCQFSYRKENIRKDF